MQLTTTAQMTIGTPEIRLYGVICDQLATAFVAELARLESEGHTLVICRVNSKGGEVYAGIAMFNAVKTAKCAVDMYVDGIAGSMASAFIMAGRKIYMSKYARIMTHKPSGGAVGNADDLRKAAEEIDECEEVLTGMYSQRTGLDKEAVTNKFLNGKDVMFNAKAALQAGLVDGIYDAPAPALAEDADDDALYSGVMAMADNNVFNQSTIDMRQISAQAWAQICMIVGITDSADDTAVINALKTQQVKAAAHDGMKAQLTALKSEVVATKVNGLLDAAEAENKITAMQRGVMAKQFAEKPDELKELLGTMGAFTSVVDKLNVRPAGSRTPEIQALMAKGWQTLEREDGALVALKAADPSAYNELYKLEFGYMPNEKPKPRV